MIAETISLGLLTLIASTETPPLLTVTVLSQGHQELATMVLTADEWGSLVALSDAIGRVRRHG